MGELSPIARADLIRRLRRLAFDGPWPGSRHQFLERNTVQVRPPNPHEGEISVGLLARILRRAGISRDDWFESD